MREGKVQKKEWLNLIKFRLKKVTLYLITNTYVLSLILALIIILSLPKIFNKYTVSQIAKEQTPTGHISYYHDLDGDGYSEKVEIHYPLPNNVGMIVFTNGGVINQWNFKGEIIHPYPMPGSTFFGDINNDGIKDVLQFTLFQDSIYLSCFNPFKDEYYIKEKAITDYYKRNGAIDCSVYACMMNDLNNDSVNEVYFSIVTGYSHYPRRMYAYDAVNDTLYKSPFGYTNFENPIAFDLDGDGKPEFISSPSAVGNSEVEDPYSDHFVWLIVLDEKMNFEFEPKIIGYFPSRTFITPYVSGKKKFLAVLNNYSGTGEFKSSITLYDPVGNKIKEKLLDKTIDLDFSILYSDTEKPDRLFLIRNDGTIEEFDQNLEIVRNYFIPENTYGAPGKYDLDNDGISEFIFLVQYTEQIIITRDDFSEVVIVDISGNQVCYYMSLIENGENGNELLVCGDKYSFIFSYGKNLLYYLRFVIYAGIYLGFYIIISVIQKAQRQLVEKKYKAEKQIAELQLRSIKNQIDPHFTLNIMNSIGSLFYKRETEKANFIFGKYSKLLRNTILSSDQILTTLKDEIDYVENYLELEKFRLNDKFEYIIEIGNSVNRELKIPKTLVHTFVENAIKHGMRHSDKKGELLITVTDNSSDYLISIRDNGIGRKNAKTHSQYNTGKGLSILEQILDLYFELQKVRITYKIIDHNDISGMPAGTEIHIKVPKMESAL